MRATNTLALLCLCGIFVQISHGQFLRPRLIDVLTGALAGNTTGNTTDAVESCPVDPLTLDLDFTSVSEGCALDGVITQGFCDACLCGLVKLYMPAFRVSGLVQQANLTGSVPLIPASTLIEECSTTFAGPLVESGIDLTGLLALGNCTFPEGEVPECVEEAFIDAANTEEVNDTATNETDLGNITDEDSPPVDYEPIGEFPPYSDESSPLPVVMTPPGDMDTPEAMDTPMSMTPPAVVGGGMPDDMVMDPPAPSVEGADGPLDEDDNIIVAVPVAMSPPPANSAGLVHPSTVLALVVAMCFAFLL